MPTRLSVLFVLLLLSGLLLAAAGAHGAPAASLASHSAAEEDFENLESEPEEEGEEEGEFAEVECETAFEEAEDGEITLAEADEFCAEAAEESRGKSKKKSLAPVECVLRSAHAHAVVNKKSGKLKLTLGYTTYEPVAAKIKVGNVATVSRQLGRSGVLRIVEPVGKRRLKRLVVSLELRAVKSAGCPFRRLVLFPR